MTTGIVKVGRWRLEVSAELWRVRRRRRVVLWGARDGEVAFGSRRDRQLEMEVTALGWIRNELLRPAGGWGGFSVVPFADMPASSAVVVEAGSAMPPSFGLIHDIAEDAQPLTKFSRIDRQGREAHAMPERDAADAEKLRAYSGARGWSPEDGDQA